MERPDDALNPWRKSTYSGTGGSDCVEIGGATSTVMVRDTKDRDGAVLDVEHGSWQRFTLALKAPSV